MTLFRSVSGFLTVLMLLASPASAADKKMPDVADAINQWKTAIEHGSVDNILSLYDKKAIMFSVFAVKPLTTRAALKDNYEQVVVNPDRRVVITESHPRRFGDIAINSGLYTLSYTQEGEPVSVPSRFSFTYILKG